ncbi:MULTISPECIES: glutathione S-transferase N-terminal domain-containing protein [unclassified Leisingera]|uniref:glutathione S-transferase N-terminal domain-containing protein n=1 Tax=unclassified Leisingera TaxID=2614906 RepID=UPI001010ACD3|nr:MULTISPECIES: glutathione S-transferase N-terminal domain-containing protein [unclassified Leisingera]MCF6433548.1 glutathione S-transferase N-terminal domain-containing protein [Leisingera sp. MMG026]QAX29095.1 glutathione S-transferase family protein [Leisingera sp. NJS204]
MREPIQLYYWPTPNGWKISIALEEMGLPYQATLIDIGNGGQFAPEFLNISPNNRMPAIIDPDGPGGAPVSLFESGAILQYLARKTGQFYGADERARLAVDQWLMWQMGGVGPMAGQAHHFLKYAPEDLPYAKDRYRNEVARLYGVLDRQLAENEYVAGPDCTIADMAVWPWASLWEGQQQVVEDKPHLARWLELMWSRPGVVAGRALHAELRGDRSDTKAQQVLFGN